MKTSRGEMNAFCGGSVTGFGAAKWQHVRHGKPMIT